MIDLPETRFKASAAPPRRSPCPPLAARVAGPHTGPMTRVPLSAEALAEALTALPGWRGGPDGIGATWRFPRYSAGAAFAFEVCLLAERLDHHPDLHIGWCTVTVRFVTHDVGGVTPRDLDAARKVNALAPQSA